MNFIETKLKGAFKNDVKRMEDEGGISASPLIKHTNEN